MLVAAVKPALSSKRLTTWPVWSTSSAIWVPAGGAGAAARAAAGQKPPMPPAPPRPPAGMGWVRKLTRKNLAVTAGKAIVRAPAGGGEPGVKILAVVVGGGRVALGS